MTKRATIEGAIALLEQCDKLDASPGPNLVKYAAAAKLRAGEDLAEAAFNMSNGELDPGETHGELNRACAAYHEAGGGE